MFTKNWFQGASTLIGKGVGAQLTKYDGSVYTIFDASEYIRFSPDIENSWLCSLPNVRTIYGTYGGVIFGTGTTPPARDDYALSGEIIKTLAANAVCNVETDDNGRTVTTTYTLTNTGDTAVTIGEIGAFTAAGNTSNFVMLERTVLDSPLTIPAGGVGQVTYTIRMNYPAA